MPFPYFSQARPLFQIWNSGLCVTRYHGHRSKTLNRRVNRETIDEKSFPTIISQANVFKFLVQTTSGKDLPPIPWQNFRPWIVCSVTCPKLVQRNGVGLAAASAYLGAYKDRKEALETHKPSVQHWLTCSLIGIYLRLKLDLFMARPGL